jgi:hypothetical protein
VEVRKNGVWGSVCNDNFNEFAHDINQTVDDRVAWVVCRQMGYKYGFLLHRTEVPVGTNQIWMDNLDCVGDETHVEQCEHNNHSSWQWGTHNCDHYKDIGVGCDTFDTDSKALAYPGIRIIQGPSHYYGSSLIVNPNGVGTPD